MTFYTGGSERMRIDTSGNVGIGTSPLLSSSRLSISAEGSVNTILSGRAFGLNCSINASAAGGTQASPTASTTSTSPLNLVGSCTYDGTNFLNVAAMVFGLEATPTISSAPSFVTFSTVPSGSTSRAERLRINSSGYVGIGTASPAFPLSVQSAPSVAAAIVVAGETNTERIHIRASGASGGTAVISLYGSRGTQASPTATQLGDNIGYYQLGGYDGTNWSRSSWISGNAEENFSATNRGSNLTFSTTPIGSTTMTERVRIDAAGNVGIGATTPGYKLEVNGALAFGQFANSKPTNSQLPVIYAAQSLSGFNYGDLIFQGRQEGFDNAHIVFLTGASSTERLRITGSGTVAVTGALSSTGGFYNATSGNGFRWGTANDGSTGQLGWVAATDVYFDFLGTLNVRRLTGGTNTIFTVNANGLAVTGEVTTSSVFRASGGANDGRFDASFTGSVSGLSLTSSDNASATYFAVFRKSDNTPIGTIRRVTTTDAVAFNTTSDRRIKENFGLLTDSGRLIDSLTPRTFDRLDGTDTDRKGWLGFVAQEVYAADPIFSRIGFVTKGDDHPTEVSKVWAVGGSPLDALLVAELKSLRARVAALEAK
jgi:hypothetical protein